MKNIEGTIASPIGFFAAGVHGKLKYKKKDIGLIQLSQPKLQLFIQRISFKLHQLI